MLIPHLDPEDIAGEMERRRRVADALRAAALMAGAPDNTARAKRSPANPGWVLRAIGRLRRVPPVSTAPVEQAGRSPSGSVPAS